MKIIAAIFLSALFISVPFSKGYACPIHCESQLDKVIYNLSAEEWIATKSADVNVSIEMSLGKAEIIKARSQILTNLQQIASGQWNITRFDPSQDSSGLERISVEAQARITEDKLNNLADKAKSVSQAGATYRIRSVNFTPSLSEQESVRLSLRNKLYLQAKDELLKLNKIYPEQSFSLFQLNFIPGEISPVYAELNEAKPAALSSFRATQSGLQVSNKMIMTANVIFASRTNSHAKNS